VGRAKLVVAKAGHAILGEGVGVQEAAVLRQKTFGMCQRPAQGHEARRANGDGGQPFPFGRNAPARAGIGGALAAAGRGLPFAARPR